MSNLDKNYWQSRYESNQIGWDVGKITTPIKEYIDQLNNKNIKILIPGAGNGYEFEYLHKKDFKNIYVVDFAESPLKNIKKRILSINPNQLINDDFFNLNDSYDLIIEQTFFCSFNPNLRENYVKKMHDLLNPNGKLVGLFFNFEKTEIGPPFGGSKEEYTILFKNYFKIITLETSYNSIKPRKDNELFAIFEKI